MLKKVFPFIALYLMLCSFGVNSGKQRTMEYQGDFYTTTFDVPTKFMGTYTGDKTGFLTLNPDGTGTYEYDIFGYAPPSCNRQAIKMEWGFVLDVNGEMIENKRAYGHSYPMLLKSKSTTWFQGCRNEVMMDYIMEKQDGLHVSSSDDWMK